MPHFFQKSQQVENRWLSLIVVTVSLGATVDLTSLAEATECLITEDDGTIASTRTEKGTPSSLLPLTIAMEREVFGEFGLSPVREVAAYMKNSRIALSNTENQGIATIGACLSQDILKSSLFNQAMIKSIGKTKINAHTQSKKVFALPYKGKKQVHTIRTTPSKIRVPARSQAATIIGPVQEIKKPILSDARSVSQVIAGLPSTVESPSQFGGWSLVAASPFASASRLRDNEPFRMNWTTAQAFHDGNCPNGCP